MPHSLFLKSSRLALPLALILTLPAEAGVPETPRLELLATDAVTDIQATVTVEKAEQAELQKISRDFGMAYRLKRVLLHYKRPAKLRMEGKIGQESALYVVNGPMRFFRIPKLGIARKDDLGASPGKQYSLLELGLVARSDLPKMQSRYLRTERIGETPAQVFEIAYRGDDTLKYVLWVAPKTHVVIRREWYDAAGKLRATFSHSEVEEVAPDVWLPTRLDISNGDGVVAGSTEYAEIKVNQNLPDSLFAIP